MIVKSLTNGYSEEHDHDLARPRDAHPGLV
jgi:hypothetical protein